MNFLNQNNQKVLYFNRITGVLLFIIRPTLQNYKLKQSKTEFNDIK